MRRIRQFAPALLVAIFWIAQVQGTVHAISHINTPVRVSDDAAFPHTLLCIECAGLAQAGAAPVLSLPATFVVTATDVRVEAPTIVFAAAGPAAAYRSRAPPLSPI